MAALAQDRMRITEVWKHKVFTLTSGTKAYKGADAVLVLGTASKVVPATTAAAGGGIRIGLFDEQVDATAADTPVKIDLEREIVMEWFANAAGGDAIAATDVGKDAYIADDQTVGILGHTAGVGRVKAGRIWAVDTKKGVAIEKYTEAALTGIAALPAFAANDSAPSSITNSATYDVPATAAASTVTLPAAAPDGTKIVVTADGTKNGHTVQYRDATGPTNLTTALTASKRHYVDCVKIGGKWFANAYVSP